MQAIWVSKVDPPKFSRFHVCFVISQIVLNDKMVCIILVSVYYDMYIYIYTYLYMSESVCIYIYICLSQYVWIYICVYICIYTYHVCKYTKTHTQQNKTKCVHVNLLLGLPSLTAPVPGSSPSSQSAKQPGWSGPYLYMIIHYNMSYVCTIHETHIQYYFGSWYLILWHKNHMTLIGVILFDIMISSIIYYTILQNVI